MRRRRPIAALVLALLASTALPALATAERGPDNAAAALDAGRPPAAGLYDATLCVAVGAAAAQCGPVLLDVFANGRADVQVSDVVYRLQPVADQLGVSLFHGTMQLDGFIVRHKWTGQTLTFTDPEKGTRYELQIGARRIAPQ
ncbi:MAG: hypothetical protein ABIR94_01915 [Rubrivivax sp.]